MEAPPPNMYTSKFGSYNANQVISAGNTGLEIPNARLDTKKNMRGLLPMEYTDSKHGMPSPGCSTPPPHRMPSSPACYTPSPAGSVPTYRMTSPAYSTLHGTPTLHRRTSPASFEPTKQHEMPSPACSVPTFHGMPSPAFDVPTTLPEMPNLYSTSAYDYPTDYDFMNDVEPQYFSSCAIDHNAGNTTTTLDQNGIHINSYGPIYIPGMVAPSQNYGHTYRHQGETYCSQGIVDPVNAQDTIQKSVLQTLRTPYDQQQPYTLSEQPTNAQQSYRVCSSSSQKAIECKPKCKYCCSFPVEFFRMMKVESFRIQHPKLCKKLDHLSNHLKRMCKKPHCGCSKYRLYHKHFIDLSRDAVKSLHVPGHQEIASNSSLNRKRGAPRKSLGRLGRPVRPISHSSITHQQEQAPETDP